MNTPSPLIPQGSLSQKALKGAGSVRIWVASIIAVHVLFFGLLLMQGCKPSSRVAETDTTTNTLTLPPFDPGTNLYSNPSNSVLTTNVITAPRSDGTIAPLPLKGQPTVYIEPVPAPVASSKEYAVQKGDFLAKIAKDNGVSLNALVKANPNVDPKKMKIGQKISIPAIEATAPPLSITGAPTTDLSTSLPPTHSTDAGLVHVVKPGETLTSIAKKHQTTVAAIRNANDMKTNRLLANQKLKIPAGKPEKPAPVAAPVGQ